MAIIRSSDLDFDQIKQSLKTYLERQSEFADYDFEASGLSNVLDVLAYNTHLNGLIANFAVNEAFLNSAQLRSSVLSHAETLGYYPRSQTGSSATVTLSIASGLISDPSFISLPANTTFTAQVDDVSYTFQTLEEYFAFNDGAGNFTFQTTAGSTGIEITEGTLRTKTFLVGDTTDDQTYVIPDETVDTSTMTVQVYDTASSSSFSTYINQSRAVRIDQDSQIYIVRESPNGYFELIFSNGNVLGQRPQAGNKIVVSYLSTSGALANGADVFIADELVDINGTDFTLTVTTTSESSGGSAKESITSIKANAPRAFSTQQRLVTSEDYEALILSNYSSYLDDVSAWGGNDNVPPEYGKVFVSLKFKDALTEAVKATVKDQIIINLSDNLAILSIDTEFVDPVNTFLELSTVFNFDPDLSGSSAKTVESQVQTLINDYINTNLNTFGATFRRSNILSEIDDLSPAILNSRMSVKVQQRFTPTVNVLSDYTLSFPIEISAPLSDANVITTSRFTYNGQTCTIKNQVGTNKLRIITLNNDVALDNVGSYSATAGTVNIVGFTPSAFEGSTIKVSIVPANQSTIRPLRNYIIDIDEGASFSQANIDYQNTAVSLTT